MTTSIPKPELPQPRQRRSSVAAAAAHNTVRTEQATESGDRTSPTAEQRHEPAAPTAVSRVDVMSLPMPAPGDGPLSATESDQLGLCESSIEELRLAFARAGRALQIVREGRLYRGQYTNFDDYVEQRWGIQRSYADKLIRAWPLAEQLRPHAPALNEGQVRELLPVAALHGEGAAVTVYRIIAETDGVRVTAGTLREAAAILPDRYDEQTAIERIRSWLRGEFSVTKGGSKKGDVFETAGTRLEALTDKVVKKTTDDPTGAREFAGKLRTLAERIESQIAN